MRILFDQGTPVPLKYSLREHEVRTAYEMGWSNLENGDLLEAAEKAFEVFVTTDKNLRYQQKLSGCRLAILVLPTTSWPRIEPNVALVVAAVSSLRAGDLVEVSFKVGSGEVEDAQRHDPRA